MSGYIHDLHGTGLIVKLEDRCKVSRGPKDTSLSGSHWCMSLTTVRTICMCQYVLWSERTVLTYCRMHGEERKLSVQPALISMADYIKQIPWIQTVAWYGTMAMVLCNHK